LQLKQFGKEKTTLKGVATSLCKNIFDKRHTLCIDNWYTSIDLAEEFIVRNTHVIGMIQSNRCRISKEVAQKNDNKEKYLQKYLQKKIKLV